MKIKGLQDEIFGDYKKPSMHIAFPYCSFKCDIENGCALCQNAALAHAPEIEISFNDLLDRYRKNEITSAIVCGGLEPFDSAEDLLILIRAARDYYRIKDDIVIYTGYTEEELQNDYYYQRIIEYGNIVIKYGRFRPNQEPHLDPILGVKLASDNQYAKETYRI